MKKIVVLLLLMVTTSVMAEWTVREYDNMSKTEKYDLRVYINGLGVGSTWVVNFEEFTNKKYKPLYCPPMNLALGASNYVDILERRINKMKKLNYYDWETSPIGLELVNGLVDTFPCDKK
jgi:hypothetical protein